MRKIMASLDFGSDSIKLVVAEMVRKKLNILSVAETPSNGMKEGVLVNPNEVLTSVKSVIKKCEDVIGLKIRQVIVGISSKNVNFSVVNGSVNINSEGNLITGVDVIRVLSSAIKGRIDDDREFITLMPTSFTLDDNRVVRDPKGLTSTKLDVRGVLITVLKKNVYPILACLERLNIDVLDISLDTIGDYYEFKSKETAKSVGVLVNLGAETTTISIFNKGVLTNTEVVLLGGKNIDNDIAFVYKTSLSDAKKLKENFALAHSRLAQASDVRFIKNSASEEIKINQYEISEVVKSRLDEMLKLTKKQINHLTKKEISYIIFTGGLTEIRDFRLVLEEIYGQSFTLGRISEIGVRHNKFSSCVGLIKYYADKARLKDKDFSIFSIEEQQLLSGVNLENDNNMIGKLFGYFFNS